MTVSRDNSLATYQGIKDAGIRFITALPETWAVVIASPLKVVDGSGSPLRVLALAPA